MDTKIKLVTGSIVLILILSIGLSLNQGQPDVRPSWVHQVEWSDKPDDAAKIEELLWAEIIPYRTEYEIVNISAKREKEDMRLRIIARTKDSDSPDIYDTASRR